MSKSIFLFFTFFFLSTKLLAEENTYEFVDTYNGFNDKLKWVNLDKEEAEFKMGKEDDFFKYMLNYKLKKAGYQSDDNTYTKYNDLYDEENMYNLLFNNYMYLNNEIWLDINMQYKDSIGSNYIASSIYRKKDISQESNIKLYYKPYSFLTTSLSFEGTNTDTIGHKSDYKVFKDNKNKKFSFNVKSDFDFFSIDTSLYQINRDYIYRKEKELDNDYIETSDKTYKGISLSLSKEVQNSYSIKTSFFKVDRDYNYIYDEEEDNSFKNIEEDYQGVELSLSKNLSEDIKVTTSAKVTDIEVTNSNLDYLIGKKPKYSPEKKADVSLEYSLKNIKFISKVSHVAKRYSDSSNNEELDSYTIGSIGASFFTQFRNKDLRIDLDIKNILNEEYYIYSDTQGDPRTFLFNIMLEL